MAELNNYRSKNFSIAFVPTMGALHQGHISLLEKAHALNTVIVASIFVNPTQFNEARDFNKYPKTIEHDVYKLEKAGCDLLFLPSVIEMYPDGSMLQKTYELGYLDNLLEGASRPGHFQGVCQVMERLLSIVEPDRLVLGQKDYQQCMVISKLVSLSGTPIEILIGDTLREPDGLAMSSRNLRLSYEARNKAPLIYETLVWIKQQLKPGNLKSIKKQAANNLNAGGFKTDYVEIANANSLQIVDEWDGQSALVILVAAFIDEIRLIDNLLVLRNTNNKSDQQTHS